MIHNMLFYHLRVTVNIKWGGVVEYLVG